MSVSVSDTSLFYKKTNNKLLVVLVYVDDILITGTDSGDVTHIINLLGQKFALKTLGEVNYFLGLEVVRTGAGLLLHQTKYAYGLLCKVGLENSKSKLTPLVPAQKLHLKDSPLFNQPTLYRSTIGALQYLTMTRPDISFAVNKLSQLYIDAYSDADWASCPDDRRSTGGHCIFLGQNLITWSSKKQCVVSRSSAESEYRSLANTASDVLWLRSLLQELGISVPNSPVIWCDNESAAALASNPVFHARTKHIEVDVHFVREKVLAKQLEIRYIPSEEQPADLFTKALSAPRFHTLCNKLSLRNRLFKSSSILKGNIEDPRKYMNNIDSMVEYEEQRLWRIEENKRKINELNLTNLAYAAMGSVKDMFQVMVSGRGNLGKSTASMAGLLKTHSQKRLSQQREDMKQQGMSLLQMKPKENILQPLSQKVHPDQSGGISSQAISQHNVRMSSEMTLPMRSQHLVKNNNNVKKGQRKTVIAPGTLGLFLRMKEISKENERLPEQRNVIGLPMETLQRQLRSCSGSQLLEGDGGCMFGLVNNDEGSQRVKGNRNTKKRQGKGRTVIAPETLGVSLCMKNKSKENHLLTKQIDVLDQSSQRHPTGYSRLQSLEGDGGCRFDLLDEDDENDGYQSSDAYGIEEHNIDPIV
ncbi:copia protein [Phtheirospermum japonicum]|uniref:Copia protein n=1 Tax=Phtheirospermum japonicum TaxID=374723 RepID=A0A830CUP2_9LAMI|nr:copia protein [Phtheirospermum japonicum]